MSIAVTHGKNQAGPKPSIPRGWILTGALSNVGCPRGDVIPRCRALPVAVGTLNRRPVGADLLPEAS